VFSLSGFKSMIIVVFSDHQAYSDVMSKQRQRSAWVIEWQSIGRPLTIKNRILHVLNPRLHPETVIKYMKLIYLNSEMESGMDRIASLTGDYWNFGARVIEQGPRITVGRNPVLVAWHLKDLTIEIDYRRSLEIFRWTQTPGERFNEEKGKVEYLGNRIRREESFPYH
jgi:hypothetical protein